MRLRLGVRLRGEALRVRLKDLHLLYEYWCFLTLVRIAAEATHRPLPIRRLLRVERSGLRLRLRRGRAQRVGWVLDGGRRLVITYNPRFAGSGYLVAQQPDLLIAIREADGTTRRYVRDAKSRLDSSGGYRQRYGIPGPPPDALTARPRYRDAIRSRTGGAGGAGGTDRPRLVLEAVALHPYRAAAPGAYAASRLGQAVGDVGVGGRTVW
jgi:hypothetical protein